MMDKQEKVDISLIELKNSDSDQLEQYWLGLEKHASTNFFLSWKWIGTWFKQVIEHKKLFLIKATLFKNIVGLGIFVEHTERRHYLIKSTQWILHRAGESDLDQIWIENNDFLTHNHNSIIIKQEMWTWLLKNNKCINEYIVSLYKFTPDKRTFKVGKNYTLKCDNTQLGFTINLSKYNNLDQYLAKRSKNSRQKIKQSIRILKETGLLEFQVIESNEQQLLLIEKSKHWHIDKWLGTPTPSGFSNNYFLAFHRALILSNHAKAKTFVASLSQNSTIIATLYCYQYERTVYFYLGNIKPMSNNKIKIGLTIHCLLIEWLIKQKSIDVYDLLAGESQYKRSLSDDIDTYSILKIQKKSLTFTIEHKLKALKRYLLTLLK